MIAYTRGDRINIVLAEHFQQEILYVFPRMEYRIHLLHILKVHNGCVTEYALVIQRRQRAGS